MKRFTIAVATLMAACALSLPAADAQARRGGVHGPAGGVAGGQIHDRTGPNGGRIVGARGAVADGQGNAAAGGVNCAKGARGAGCRAGKTTRTADGTVTHRSRVEAQGANGNELSSTGGFTKAADGTVSQGRSTTASGAKGSVDVDSSYSSEAGRTRTATCANAAGQTVTCPSR